MAPCNPLRAEAAHRVARSVHTLGEGALALACMAIGVGITLVVLGASMLAAGCGLLLAAFDWCALAIFDFCD